VLLQLNMVEGTPRVTPEVACVVLVIVVYSVIAIHTTFRFYATHQPRLIRRATAKLNPGYFLHS